MPTIDGEKLAIRLFSRSASIPHLDRLGFPQEQLGVLHRVSSAPHGFVVAAGPTGSGKTTTLYALMTQRNVLAENLCSIEDPIEIRIPGMSQLQVNSKAGVTFATALRAFLRQDPNVIMVGEMRDEQTAAVAAAASLSGQLVLTTVHSNNAAGAIDRLLELGVSRRTIAAGLTAVVGQRLVRKLCQLCRREEIAGSTSAANLGIPADMSVFRPVGCVACLGTGYRGRCAVFEILAVDDALREAIVSGVSAMSIETLAKLGGFRPMREHALEHLRNGQTGCAELRRIFGFEAPPQ